MIYGGEPPSFVADAALSKNMPFIIRVMPTFTYLPKKGAHGEAFNTYTNYFSNDTMWYEAAELIKTAVQWSSHFQGFFPIVYTSDDFSIHGGWDWADKNVERMYSLYGINISNNSNSIPAEINNTVPDYYSVDVFTSKTKGNISVNDSWLVYNQFVSKDVLGTYNQRVVQKVVNATSNARVYQFPAGCNVPLFSISNGQYPPYNFGNSSFNGGNTSFNMVSYYMYLNYWLELAYIYWTDIARMGSRDLPVYVMPDALMTEESYIWNNFYLLLAAGVNGVSYFVDDDSSDTIQFWNVTNQRIGTDDYKVWVIIYQTSANYTPRLLYCRH